MKITEPEKMKMDIEKIRADFPILRQKVHGKPLVYFDNGATTQKPKAVLQAIEDFYTTSNSNIHRGVHFLSQKATRAYENARNDIQHFINAKNRNEIVFTRSTTEGINLVAFSFGEKYISKGDEIIVTQMEHHSNIIPWQLLAQRKAAKLKVVPVDESGQLQLDVFEKLITEKTKIVALTHVSNTLGTINPVKEIIEKAHRGNIPVLLDGAQGIQHIPVDVQDLDCDFYAFSGHKLYAATGIGVLYGKEKWLNDLPPYQSGGEMVDTVSFDNTTFQQTPLKFEAGTPNYVGAVSISAALRYLQSLGIENIMEYERALLSYATKKIKNFKNIRIYGNAPKKCSTISFGVKGVHHLDVGMVLDKIGIAVRTGTHCCQPLMKRYGITGTVRISLVYYNTFQEIDKLEEGLQRIEKMFT